MSKNVKTKTKKTVKKTVARKPKKPVIKRRAAKTKAKPTRMRITHSDIEKKIDEIDINSIIKKERDKRMILWAGVSFFMVLIFVFWIFNLKQTFKKIESENVRSSDFSWNEITEDFSKSMDEMKENLAEIKEFAEITEDTSTSTEESIATTTGDIFLDRDEINQLKARLEELEDRLGTSSLENNVQ